MKKKVNIGAVVAVLLCALCAFGFINNFDFCVDALAKVTVLSASTVLPVGFDMGDEKENENENKNETELTDTESEKEDTTAESTTKATAENKAQTTKSENKSESTFTETPDDIKKLVEKYEKSASKDKKGGAISEQTYKNSGVTDSYGNVRVKNINDTAINVKKLLSEKADLNITDKSQPTVLIFHTHTTETYQISDRDFYAKDFSPRSEDAGKNMIRVGDAICDELEKAGYAVIHDTNIYDKKYNGAYNRSREQIEKYLEKYPTIQIVLDIHRDAIQLSDGTKIKPVATVQGKKCAQLMIISGCQESGNGITGFDDWRCNLIFGVQLQEKLESQFSGITRPLYFCPRKYNMDTSHCSLLIEVGSDANTLDEAVYAGKCLGVSLAELMNEYTKG